MNVFILNEGADTGGQGIRIKDAFDRYTDWNVRTMHTMRTYLQYPFDLEWDEAMARELWADADVVHVKCGTRLYHELGGGKPVVVHYQGSELRDNPAAGDAAAKAIGAKQIVSTVDLLADCDGTWLPIPHDLDALRDKYRHPRNERTLVIGHAPTNRAKKGTDIVERVIGRLSAEYDIRFDLVTGISWAACLSRKGQCDVFIDQLTLGYGNSGIEAMAMGVPVISGWSDDADRARFVEETGEDPPFVYANDEETLEEALRLLIESREAREEWGAAGRDFAERWHDSEKVVERLIPIYEAAVREQVAS